MSENEGIISNVVFSTGSKGTQKQRKKTRNKKKPSQLAGKKTSIAEDANFIPIKVKSRRGKRLADDIQCV